MTAKKPHPTDVQPYRYSLADRLYLPLLEGMWVTISSRGYYRALLAHRQPRRPQQRLDAASFGSRSDHTKTGANRLFPAVIGG